jgi:hypothetical protein
MERELTDMESRLAEIVQRGNAPDQQYGDSQEDY